MEMKCSTDQSGQNCQTKYRCEYILYILTLAVNRVHLRVAVYRLDFHVNYLLCLKLDAFHVLSERPQLADVQPACKAKQAFAQTFEVGLHKH